MKQVLQHGPLSRMESGALPSVTAQDIFNDCYRTFGSKVLLVMYDMGFHLVYSFWKSHKASSNLIFRIQNSEMLFYTTSLRSSFNFAFNISVQIYDNNKVQCLSINKMLIIGWKRTLSLQQFKFTIAINALHHHFACSCSWKPQYPTVILGILKHFSTSSI